MVPACPSSATSQSTSSGSHHQKSYPSPLKRTQRPRKRRPKAATKTHIPHPLIPNLSRPMKTKYSKSHSHLPKFPVQKLIPLMSINTGISMEGHIVIEMPGG